MAVSDVAKDDGFAPPVASIAAKTQCLLEERQRGSEGRLTKVSKLLQSHSIGHLGMAASISDIKRTVSFRAVTTLQ
jgi:hypothetical protein